MKHLMIFSLAIFCIMACNSQKALQKKTGQKDFYACKGNEPYWSIDMEADVIIFSKMGEDKIYFPYRDAQNIDGAIIFKTFLQDGNKSTRLQITITKEECMDSMSGEASPYTVFVKMDGESFSGCAE